MYIDTHCHMYSEYYNDFDNYINNASDNNVKKIIVNAVDRKTSLEILDIVQKYNNVYGAIGYHPTELDKITEKDIKWLEEHIDDNKIIALGEIGLDYHYENTDKEKQIKIFKRQLKVAEKHNKPIIVHTRDSIQETYNILKETNNRGIIHCFSGSVEMAREFIKLGYLIGIGGIATYKNANNMIKVIKDTPLEYIVLETDAPYLTPEPYRKNINESKYISIIASKIGEIKGIETEEVMMVTTSNVMRQFDF